MEEMTKMLLLIEESNKDRNQLKKEITEMRKTKAEHSANTVKQDLEDILKTDLIKNTQNLK